MGVLTGSELDRLFSQVFGYVRDEHGHRFAFLVDVPASPKDDTEDWQARRKMAVAWAAALMKASPHICVVYAYEAVARGNADLIHPAWLVPLGTEIPSTAEALSQLPGLPQSFETLYPHAEYWVALTQLSATAPLKIAASQHGFRAATMPGFTQSMLPALGVDIEAIDARVTSLARSLTEATGATLWFSVGTRTCELYLDLRFRMGFASSGRLVQAGQAGNLPSGEAYIVPYEGEKLGIASETRGTLPIQRGADVVFCDVLENRITRVDGENSWADAMRDFLAVDAARANIAELGLGVLGEWGIPAVGHVLLDEKLAVHVALGRSEHLGGVTSPADFTSPQHVCHIDYVYHPRLMPDVRVARGVLHYADRDAVFMVDGIYC